MKTEDIIRRIDGLQEIQKANPPSSAVWRDASRKLAPLFAEMAKREPRREISTR